MKEVIGEGKSPKDPRKGKHLHDISLPKTERWIAVEFDKTQPKGDTFHKIGKTEVEQKKHLRFSQREKFLVHFMSLQLPFGSEVSPYF